MEIKLDANETVFFERELERIRSTTYDVKYPDLKARLLIPADTEVQELDETVVYKQMDWKGMAKIISNHADDLPYVDVIAKEFSAKIRDLGDAYYYSVVDIRRAAKAGKPLTAMKSQAARAAMERTIDRILAFGDADYGLQGFLNHPNVPLIAPITGTWSTATPDQILADLAKLVDSPSDATNDVENPNTLVLPVSIYRLIRSQKANTNTDKTVLQNFLERNPGITSVETWNLLETADVAGTGPRAVVYNKDPEKLVAIVPMEYREFPAQAHNLSFKVPAMARCGGVEIRYPLSVAYMDGI